MDSCPHCGKIGKAKARFCTKCGKEKGKGAEKKRKTKSGRSTKCSKCSHKLKAGARFCTKCGTAQSEPKTPTVCVGCAHKLKKGAVFCTKCGTPQRKDEGGKKEVVGKKEEEKKNKKLGSKTELEDSDGEQKRVTIGAKRVTIEVKKGLTKEERKKKDRDERKKKAKEKELKKSGKSLMRVSGRSSRAVVGEKPLRESQKERVSPRGRKNSLSKSNSNRRSVNFRESIRLDPNIIVSNFERQAALDKIDALVGSSEIVELELRCVIDQAVEGVLNGESLQQAWNLPSEHDLHIIFVGLLAPDGCEIPFETSAEIPWPHIPFWEEVIFEDEVYEILYEDDRDELVEKLTDDQITQIENMFDEMDVDCCEYLSQESLEKYFKRKEQRKKQDLDKKKDKLLKSALSKRDKLRVGSAISLSQNEGATTEAQIAAVMAMDIDGSKQVRIHEYVRGIASKINEKKTTRGKLSMSGNTRLRQSARGKRMSMRVQKGMIGNKSDPRRRF